MGKVKSFLEHDNQNKRAIFNASLTNSAPSTANEGWDVSGKPFTHLYAHLGTGLTAAEVDVYYYSEVSGLWHLDRTLSVSPTQNMFLLQSQGETKVYFHVTSLTGAGVFRLWGGTSHEDGLVA